MLIKYYRHWRRRRLIQRNDLDSATWDQTVARLPLLARLNAEERARLRELVIIFLHEKHFVGAHELALDNPLLLAVAAQACLPILNLGIDSYAGWESVILYPAEFLTEHEYQDEAGVVHVVRDIMVGEAWLQGPLILSARDALRSGETDGINVVLHECAHKLDMLNGDANGYPPLHRGMRREAWRTAFSAAYADLSQRLDAGEHTRIDGYAATNPGEFFAVLSEVFFETPQVLLDTYPAVYAQMVAFYQQTPLAQ